MLFDVRVLSFDAARKDPVQALMRVFKIDQPSAEQIVHVVPRVVKSGIPLETARRLSHILGALGARTEVVTAGGRVRAAGESGARSSTVDLEGRASQFALPRPSPVALGTLASRTPANGNGNGNTGGATKPVAAIRLSKVRARREVKEVPASPDSVRRDSSLYMGRVRPGSAPDPSLMQALELPESLEADIAPARSTELSPAPRSLPAAPDKTLAGHVQRLSTMDPIRRTASVLTALMLVSLSVLSLGVLPVLLLGAYAFDLCFRWARGRSIEASAVEVTAAQLPELHRVLSSLAQRLGLAHEPRLFVTAGVPRGLSSVSYRGRTALLLSAETLVDHTEPQHTNVLHFMLAHELSAVTLGQRTTLRAFLAWLWPAVRKLDVLAADALSVELLGAASQVEDALVALLTGPRALALFDRAELLRQAEVYEQKPWQYAPALPGQAEFLLSRLQRMRRAG